MESLADLIIDAWYRTKPCPDGDIAPFCPSCLYQTIKQLIEGINNE
jgi:hypothetical protein